MAPVAMFGVYPDKSTSIEYPTVFVNNNYRGVWSERSIVLGLIHEATHLTPTPKGWLCGSDRSDRGLKNIPVCNLFGRMQFASHEITAALEGHLERELSKLDNSAIRKYE